jgi:hypothetical protein
MIKTALYLCALAGVLLLWCLRPDWHVKVAPRVHVLGFELGVMVRVDLAPIPESPGDTLLVRRSCVVDTVNGVLP